HVVGLEPAVLGSPAVIGRLADLQLLGHLRHVLALGQQPVSLPELADDLLGGVAASLHGVLLPIGAVGLSLVHHPCSRPEPRWVVLSGPCRGTAKDSCRLTASMSCAAPRQAGAW